MRRRRGAHHTAHTAAEAVRALGGCEVPARVLDGPDALVRLAASLNPTAGPTPCLRRTARKMMPKADIGDVVQEVMSWHPEFIASYTHISRGGPISADMATSLAAVLTAQALNVGWAPVVSPGVEALTRSRINHVYQSYVRPECHAAANAPLIWGQDGIPTATPSTAVAPS